MAHDITAVVCIYAPTGHARKLARAALDSARRELGPDATIMAAVDRAPGEWVEELARDGYKTISVDGGHAPRMSRLVARAANTCETPYLLTVEMDVELGADDVAALRRILDAADGKTACVEARYKDIGGSPTYPTSSWRASEPGGPDGARISTEYATLGATLWRTEALRAVNWGKVPPLRGADMEVGRQLIAAGWTLLVAENVMCLHHGRQSFRARKAAHRRHAARKKRGVVVTAIYGGKNTLREPKYAEPELDYVCFTDDPTLTSSIWDVRLRQSEYTVPILAAKEYKVFPHRFLPEYAYSVWMDASMEQRGPFLPLIEKHLAAHDIAFFKHPKRRTLRAEAEASVRCDVESAKRVRGLLHHAWAQGFRASKPLVLCGLIFRRHTERHAQLMDAWWNYIAGWCHQDQMSIPLVSHEIGIDYAVIAESFKLHVKHSAHAIKTRGQWRNWDKELPVPGRVRKAHVALAKPKPVPEPEPEAGPATPTVDVVIPTIGRASLKQAILAACAQTYPRVRVVVIADGPGTGAREIVESIAPLMPQANVSYYETPTRLGGYGDFVKRWWIDHADAGEWIRFLDDDDWIPPNAIAEMVIPIKKDTALVLCGMVVMLAAPFTTTAWEPTKRIGRYEFRDAALAPHRACSGMSMIRTEFARRSKFPAGTFADFELCKSLANQGGYETTALPLYWYNGHQGGKVSTMEAAPGNSYPRRWVFKPPRSFRKSLFRRVPLANYFKPDGAPWLIYDQALMRPMDHLARKRAWITRAAYSYMPAPEPTKCYTRSACHDDMMAIIKRGFVQGDDFPPLVETAHDAPLIHWIMPAYHATDTIARALKSIATQNGELECTIVVDGNDRATAEAARQAIGDDRRFHVIVQPDHLLPLRNVLSAFNRVGEEQVIAMCDADDWLYRDDVNLELISLYHDPDVEIVCGTNHALVLRK